MVKIIHKLMIQIEFMLNVVNMETVTEILVNVNVMHILKELLVRLEVVQITVMDMVFVKR